MKTISSPTLAVVVFGEKAKAPELEETSTVMVAAAASATKALRLRTLESMVGWRSTRIKTQLLDGNGSL